MNENIIVQIGADISQFLNGINNATSQLHGLGSSMQSIGGAMAKSMGAATLAIGAGIGVAVKSFSSFDTEMRKAGAIAGASADQLDAMKASAIDLGAKTSKGASEIAVAFSDMAAKGFDANQVIAAMPGIISASEASGEDLALTANTVSTALNVWGLEAKESSRVADVLAESANTSAAGIDDLGYVLKYAGAPAAALGISLEEVAAAAGIMTSAGLDGSSAGTSLRASLLALNNPAKAQQKIMKELGFSLTDSSGEAKGLAEMVGDLGSALEGETEAQKVATLGKLVGTEAVSGFLSLMKAGPAEIEKMTNSLENSAGASKAAADQMMAGIGGAFEQLSGAVESSVLILGEKLAPTIQNIAEYITGLIEKFNGLSEGTQEFIAKAALVTVGVLAIGTGIGILIMGVGSVISTFATITGVMATVAGSLGIAGGAAGLLGAAFTVMTGPIGIAVAALVALGLGVGVLVDHFNDDALPAIDRFGEDLEGVSDSTKVALGAFFDLSDGISESMSNLSITSATVTSEIAADMVSKFSAMNQQILDGMNQRHADQMASMQEFFANSSVLTDTHEQSILQKTLDAHTQEVAGQEAKEERIIAIMEKAAEEKRALTEREKKIINEIQESMQTKAVEVLSASEMEQKIIMERLKETASTLSAQQAAEVVKNSAKQRDGVVKEAEGQYDDTIAEIIRMRDETGVISEEQATKLIAEAKKQRDGTVKHAEDMHADIVSEAQKQATGHINKVDWETGEILSKWAVFKNDISTTWKATNALISAEVSKMANAVSTKFTEMKESVSKKMAEVLASITTKWGEVMAFFTGIDLRDIGTNIIAGLIKGISDKFGDVKAKIKELADIIPDGLKKFLGIHSPSKVTEEDGRWTTLGFVKGIEGEFGAVKKVATSLAEIPKLAMQAADPIEKSSPKTKKRAGKLKGILLSMKAPKIQINEVTLA